MKIIITDDHKLIRDCIKSMVNNNPLIEIVGEAANGRELLEIFPNSGANVVIMDISMPEMDGIEAMTELIRVYNFSKVIVLTMLHEGAIVRKMMDMGAVGYLLKSCGAEELLNAINMVGSGHRYISPEITLNLLNMEVPQQQRKTESPKLNLSSISKREMEVLKLVAEGLTNGQIADKLFNSRRTIESHRRNLIEKTGTKNSAELVKFALSHGILN